MRTICVGVARLGSELGGARGVLGRALHHHQFPESVTTGVQGEPACRATLPVVHDRESIMRSGAGECWIP